MRKFLFAGLLAVGALGVTQSQAAAQVCFEVHKPCWQFPLPRIPLFVPSIKFYCEPCTNGCQGGGGMPWYTSFPPQQSYGYQFSPYGGFRGPTAYYGGGYYGAPQQQAYYPNHGYDPGYGNGGGHQAAFAPPGYWYNR